MRRPEYSWSTRSPPLLASRIADPPHNPDHTWRQRSPGCQPTCAPSRLGRRRHRQSSSGCGRGLACSIHQAEMAGWLACSRRSQLELWCSEGFPDAGALTGTRSNIAWCGSKSSSTLQSCCGTARNAEMQTQESGHSAFNVASGSMPIGIGVRWRENRGTLYPGDGMLLVSDGMLELLGAASRSSPTPSAAAPWKTGASPRH